MMKIIIYRLFQCFLPNFNIQEEAKTNKVLVLFEDGVILLSCCNMLKNDCLEWIRSADTVVSDGDKAGVSVEVGVGNDLLHCAFCGVGLLHGHIVGLGAV